MAISTFVFWLVALMTVSSAVVVVAARNILHAAFALCICFLGVGALYVLLHADFVAAVQLIVYVGGILVLIMFAIMFSSNVNEDTSAERRGWFSTMAGALAALAVFAGFCLLVRRLDIPLKQQNLYAKVDYVNTVGVTPSIATSEDVALVDKHTDLLESISTLSDENARAEIIKHSPTPEEGTKIYDAWKQFKGHTGIGHKIAGEFVLPFEVVSLLLLAALVGAVVIVRKELN